MRLASIQGQEYSPTVRYEFIPAPACEMCGSQRHSVLGMRLNRSQGLNPRRAIGIGVTVKQCLDCDLIFADPRPRPMNLSDHYGVPPESYWVDANRPAAPDYFGAQIAEAKALLGFRPGMAALDIGAGLGKAMAAMERGGFSVEGIEPSETFRRKAVEFTKIAPERLHCASIEEADFPEATFDWITFGAVLEHIQEPGAAVQRAVRWLKPGGVIHAEVPSSHYFMSKVINAFFALKRVNYVTNLSPMHPPYHLYEFGLDSFRKHGQRVGYEVARHYFYVCDIPHLPRFLHPLLSKWMAKTDQGMQLTVWLRRR